MVEFFEAWVIWISNTFGIEDLEYAGTGPIIAFVSIVLGLAAFAYLFRFAMRPFIPLFRGETLADYGRIHEPKPKRMREQVKIAARDIEDDPVPAFQSADIETIEPDAPPVIRILPLDDFVRGDGVDRTVARELANGLHETLQRVPSVKTQKACLSSPAQQPCQANGRVRLYVVAGTVKQSAHGAFVRLCIKDARSGERIWTRNEEMTLNNVAALAQEFAIEIGGAVIMRQGSAKDLLQRTSPRAVTRQSSSMYPSDRPQEIEPPRTFDQPAA